MIKYVGNWRDGSVSNAGRASMKPQVQAPEPCKVSRAWHTPTTLVLGMQGQKDPRGQSNSSSRFSKRRHLKTELRDNKKTTPGMHIHTQNRKHTHTCTRGCGGHRLHTHSPSTHTQGVVGGMGCTPTVLAHIHGVVGGTGCTPTVLVLGKRIVSFEVNISYTRLSKKLQNKFKYILS